VNDARLRERRGPVRLVNGIPYSNRDTTLSLIPGAAVGEWLHAHRGLVHGRLLDAGCGNKPYEPWYSPLVSSSIALDAAPLEGVDVVGFADRLPFAAETFDTVLCTEVLEHVQDAERAAAELFRVTRPGGTVLVTVPYLYPTHEAPYDMRRFTHFGLADLMARHGFEVLDVEAKGGAGRLLAHYVVLFLVAALGPLTRFGPLRALLAYPQEAFLRVRRTPLRVRGTATRISLGYMLAARRP
jgi:SAM-dependent methyltransferase